MTIPLSTDRILRAAFDLLDSEGAAGLTMRGLAARLTVQAPSLYHHVRGKRDVHILVADAITKRLLSELSTDAGWRDALTALAIRLRALLREHPGATMIVATQDVSPEVAASAQPLVTAIARDLGVDLEQAGILAQSLVVLVTGLGLAEFGNAPEPPVAPREYYDRWFELALVTFLDGVAARIARSAS